MALQQEQIKWIAGTNFMVDGFRFQNSKCTHYFLTHYHSDHTIGLYKSFTSGTVFCSKITAALLTNCMGLPSEHIQILPLNEAVMIEGVEVTALDANHCPGSVMLLFKVPGQGRRPGQVILHTGDFRYHHCMAEYPSLQGTLIDVIYLDTTYAYPRHTFPPQEDAIATIVKLCKKHLSEEARTLFVFGSYQIGKERAVIGAAVALGLKVHIEPRKRRILSLLELENMHVFTGVAAEANIHLGFMSEVRPPAMLRRLKEGGGQWEHVVGFRPTGWSFRRDGVQTTKQGLATVYGVPYSEHSSFDDLRACVATLRPRKIIPTVNADTKLKAENLVARFADLMDLSANRYRIDAFFRPRFSKAASGRSGSGLTTDNTAASLKEAHQEWPAELVPTKTLANSQMTAAKGHVDDCGDDQAWESEGLQADEAVGADCEGVQELEELEAADGMVSELGGDGDPQSNDGLQTMDDRFSDAQEEFENKEGVPSHGERTPLFQAKEEDGCGVDVENSGCIEKSNHLFACSSAECEGAAVSEREEGVRDETDRGAFLGGIETDNGASAEDSLTRCCKEASTLAEPVQGASTLVQTASLGDSLGVLCKEELGEDDTMGTRWEETSADVLLRDTVSLKQVDEKRPLGQECLVETSCDHIDTEAAPRRDDPAPRAEGSLSDSVACPNLALARETCSTEHVVKASTRLEQSSASCCLELDVDLSAIDNREQAYILRCIEQSRLNRTDKPTAKRKEMGKRGVSKKGGEAVGKKAKASPPEVPTSGSKVKPQGQTLIQSFFWSRRA